jgi:hypothetical protein
MIQQYQPLPESGIVPLGFYESKHGRVWVTKGEPKWIHDTVDTGHYEETYKTELSGVDGTFYSLVSVEVIKEAFEERNKIWAMNNAMVK